MSMTKKHYTELVSILKKRNASDGLIDDICEFLRKDNPRFDETRFRAALKKGK